MPRLVLTLAYQGTRYAGWQLQTRPGRKQLPTVQGEIEKAVSRIAGQRIPVHGAGRTDSGVHADGQVCHLDLPEAFAGIDWPRALNVSLPEDIRILEARFTGRDFHARASALRKRYVYSLWMHRDRARPRIAPFVWSVPPLDLERAAPLIPELIGRRDFASLRNAGNPMDNTVRTIYSIRFDPGRIGPLACPAHWPVTSLVVEGDGFLKQMVRNLAGLLVWIALGKLDPAAVPGILTAKNRAALPSPSAPARGLTLLEVIYGE